MRLKRAPGKAQQEEGDGDEIYKMEEGVGGH